MFRLTGGINDDFFDESQLDALSSAFKVARPSVWGNFKPFSINISATQLAGASISAT